MRLALTPEQCAALERWMQPGTALLARTERDGFDGTNAATSGRLSLVFVSIPAERLDAVRNAISGEQTTPKTRRKSALERLETH